jgi:hypothetical protein
MVSAYSLACLLRSFSKIHIVSRAGPIHPDPPGTPFKPRSCSGDRFGIKHTKVSAICSMIGKNFPRCGSLKILGRTACVCQNSSNPHVCEAVDSQH